jgi:plastocyanin
MRRSLLLVIALVALTVAACSSATTPGWTYAPPTPSPTVDPNATAAPSVEPSAAPSDGPSGGDALYVSAINIAFEQTELSTAADTPFVIRFENKEAVPHNVEIKDAGGMSMFKGEIVTGPTVIEYQVPALPAGSYQFVCTVHPNMVGTLTSG